MERHIKPKIGTALLTLVICLGLITSTTAAEPTALSIPDSSVITSATAAGDSISPVITPDGRYVLFGSTARNLVLLGTNTIPPLSPQPQDIYLCDRESGTIILISCNLSGTGGGNADSTPIDISANGRYILFESSASNLVAYDTNDTTDVFIHDLQTASTTLVSVSTNSRAANGTSSSSTMTPDAHYVAFVSEATNLVPDDTNRIADVFLRDLQTGVTTLVSVGAMTTNAANPSISFSESPEITPDGHYVAFFSTATNLVSGIRTVGEIYVRDLTAGVTTLVSTNARSIMQTIANTTNTISYNHAISADGNFVAYEISPVSLPRPNIGVIARYNLATRITSIISTNAVRDAYAQDSIDSSLKITPDGRFITYLTRNTLFPGATNTSVYVWDTQTGMNILASPDISGSVSSNLLCSFPYITPSGRFVAFIADRTSTNAFSTGDLTTNSYRNSSHVYIRDLQTSTTRMIDVGLDGIGAGLQGITFPSVSDDGRFVAFESSASTLVANDQNRGFDVFIRDTSTDTTELISRAHPFLPSSTANAPSSISRFSISTNGNYVTFSSLADNLVLGDTNGFSDIIRRDLTTGSNILASVGTNGAAGNGNSTLASISGDGRFIAFVSSANNLVPGDANKLDDIFVRDLQLSTTLRVSASTNAVSSGIGESSAPFISTDGRYVLFRSRAPRFAADPFRSNSDNLFLHDLQGGNIYALTTNGVASQSITPDGRYVVYSTTLPSAAISVWDSQLLTNIYSTNISSESAVAISSDGTHIAYSQISIGIRVVNLTTQSNWQVTTNSPPANPGFSFSENGLLLAYVSKVTSGTNNQVNLYNFQTGTNLLISKRFNSILGGSGNSDSPVISPDGRFIAYRSQAPDIIPGDTNRVPDLFLYDRLLNSTMLVSIGINVNRPANNRSLSPVFSRDSQTLIFQSWASDLISGDFNQKRDIFALKLSSVGFADADHDGMDDAWEMRHFGTLARNGSEDFDSDGATDLFEFQTGTLPDDSHSIFQGQIIFDTNPTIRWTIAPGSSYRVQFKNDLNDPVWQDFDGNVTFVGTQASANDLFPAAQRFYRIILAN